MGKKKSKKQWRVEYLRPDGWWLLAKHRTPERCQQQITHQLNVHPDAHYRVQVMRTDDVAEGSE